MYRSTRGRAGQTVAAALARLRACNSAFYEAQRRCLSELYLASKGSAPGKVERGERAEKGEMLGEGELGKTEPMEQPTGERPTIISSIPAPKTYSREIGELPPVSRAQADAVEVVERAKGIAKSYMQGLHNEQWSADETWMRFTALPSDSYKHLRNIDVDRTLARIRGSERDFARVGRSTPTTKTLNRMLTVYGTATRAGMVPDRYTYQELIAVNVGLMNFKHAREWLEEMVLKGTKPTIRPYRTLLKGYSSVAGEIDNARQLWQEIKQKIESEEIVASETSMAAATLDRETYTCMISAECKVGNFAQVLNLMHEMSEAGIEADITVRNVILKGILDQNGLDAGLEEVAFIKSDGLAPDAFTYNILLGAAIAERRGDTIRELLSESAKKGIIPSSQVIQSLPLEPIDALDIMIDSGGLDSIRVYNTLIKAATRRNKFSRALQLIGHLRSHGIQPNETTYGLLLDALSKANRPEEAKAVYDEIVQEGVVKPDAYIFSTMVDACGRSGNIKGMFWFKSEMKKYNLPPSELVYNSILSTLSRARRVNLQLVMNVVNEFTRIKPAIKPTVRTYSAIFAAFTARSHTESLTADELRFLRVWYRNTKDKYYVPKDAYLYALAIDAFSGASCLEDALMVYRDMVAHAELDPSVLQKFTQSPSRMLELMRLSIEQQQFDTTLDLWRDWRPLRLPASERAVGLMLFASDQLGHIKTAQDTIHRLLTPSKGPKASHAPLPEQNGARSQMQFGEDLADPSRAKLPEQEASLYNPELVGESALAIYIGLAIKHRIPEDIIPTLELWRASADSSALAPSSARLQLSGGIKRQLSEATVAKILKMLQHSDLEEAGRVSDDFLAFVEDNFPEAMPL
ncbi:hypothetical protein GQ54DRAFT_207231 [Martensiomyces pterosporus]|nr:hypothetical protein GQ54DRAFT_207231 [Martensiomyces pterosporus]